MIEWFIGPCIWKWPGPKDLCDQESIQRKLRRSFRKPTKMVINIISKEQRSGWKNTKNEDSWLLHKILWIYFILVIRVWFKMWHFSHPCFFLPPLSSTRFSCETTLSHLSVWPHTSWQTILQSLFTRLLLCVVFCFSQCFLLAEALHKRQTGTRPDQGGTYSEVTK